METRKIRRSWSKEGEFFQAKAIANEKDGRKKSVLCFLTERRYSLQQVEFQGQEQETFGKVERRKIVQDV